MDYPARFEWQTRCEFNAYCKRTLRNELIDACRERKSRKRHEVCKNRHPSPICTRFEPHFHALKPHLRCLSFKLPRSRSARPYMFKFGR